MNFRKTTGPLIVLVSIAVSQVALAKNDAKCSAIIKSAQDAASKADWIIEGNVINTFKRFSPPGRIEVSIENAKTIFESEQSPRFFTASLQVDACFSPDMAMLSGKNAEKLVGRRMRFFGTKLTSGLGGRIFFMQPAAQAITAFPVTHKKFADRKNATHVLMTGSDGWSRVQSAEGRFSIEMPGEIEDISKGSGEQAAYMLRGTDPSGTKFIAVFERSGPGSGIGANFDSMMSKPDTKLLTFKGAEAIATSSETPDSGAIKVMHGLWFRVPGGTFMLGIATDKANENEAHKVKERFFSSLNFE